MGEQRFGSVCGRDVETGSCEEGLDGFEKESLFDSVFGVQQKIDCFVLGKTKIDMLGWVSCLQLVFRRVNDSTDLKHFKVLGR